MIVFLTSLMIVQFWAVMIFGGLLYWLPPIVALARQSESRGGIAALNFLFGWTGFGWIAAMVWAIGSTTGYRPPYPQP